ncbi:MAG: methionine ABC transporter ATP-binding protein [Anaeroplasma sp.]
MEIIKIDSLTKIYNVKRQKILALENINLKIDKGDIFGIIGLSGAGKSTLIRCINYLEKPTSGNVYFNNICLGDLKNKELRKIRQSIGMIFQNFNLLEQSTVIKNVMFPLEIAKNPNKYERALELLKIVGLEDKKDVYPSQLSGGQKQRVAIARALANNPDVLLCDEATSALDPNTTNSILELLKEINHRFGITIIIITHEMRVVESICNKVAIIDESKIKEVGLVKDIFINPQTQIAKNLIFPSLDIIKKEYGRMLLRLEFNGEEASLLISELTLKTKLMVKIIEANIKSQGANTFGNIVIQIPDDETAIAKIKSYLISKNVKFEEEVIE